MARQFWLVGNFGPEVNLGNVRLEEVQYLEHVRLGTWPVFGFGPLGDHPYQRVALFGLLPVRWTPR